MTCREYCAERAARILNRFRKSLNGSRILLLGVAYKQDIDDYRESPALRVMMHLENAGAEVVYYDPFVSEVKEGGKVKRGEPVLDADLVRSADLVIVTTAHTKVDYAMVQANAKAVFDTKNAMRNVVDRSNIELL